jgi:hypothetical protein
MFDILSIIPGKKKHTSSGWTSFNAICCSHFGHKSDRRMRGGIKFDGQHNWSFHCFNCGFKCNFTIGRSISVKTRQLLSWCGIDEIEIQRWSLESLQHKDLLDFTPKKRKKIKFNEHQLPLGELVDKNNPQHKVYVDYLKSRKIDSSDYPFLITPNERGRMNQRVVIPYTYKGKIVGHTSRFLDNKTPKYINEQQPGYVFNIDMQRDDWQVCILTEGIFDALSIDGVAVMHDDISNEQAELLSTLNRQIIVVPDRDKTGMNMIEKALSLGYQVSLPDWDKDIKDVNDAVVKYGKLQTLLSIIQSATNSKIKLELQRKKIGKQNGF